MREIRNLARNFGISQSRTRFWLVSDPSSDDYIIYLKCYNASLQQQLATEAKPRTKLTNYRDKSRHYIRQVDYIN